MSRIGETIAVLLGASIAASIGMAAACAGASQEKQVAAVEYAALEQACVQRASTRLEATACIAVVRLALCGDGGPLAGPVLHCGDAPVGAWPEGGLK